LERQLYIDLINQVNAILTTLQESCKGTISTNYYNHFLS